MRRFLLIFMMIASLIGAGVLPFGQTHAAAASKSGKTSDNTSSEKSDNSVASSLPQTYNADGKVLPGMIVKLKDKDSTSVEPVSTKNVKTMLGIVIPTSNAAIVLTPLDVKQQQVLVATSGRYYLLVSTENGPIKIGDYLTISSLNGVAMKADDRQAQVVGKAAGVFNGTNDVIGTVKLKYSLGREIPVSIGRIQIDMNISHNPLYQKSVDYVPGFIASVAVTVANKPVSIARIYLCTLILIITFIVTVIMLYGGVRSGMIAVGRNPLSKKSILRSLIQTVLAGLTIFIVGIFAVYLLLKL